MAYSKEAYELLKEIEFLYERYSHELRATTQPFLLKRVQSNVKNYKYHPEDLVVRETLLEHIGSLPMTAVAFYPFINDKDVDLGKALSMLAIHDIGELITGDEITFTKKQDSKKAEYEAALKLLHSSYHELYEETEKRTSKSALFAKAIDKITPDIIDYLTPADITIWRYEHFVNMAGDKVVDMIVEHKRPYMLWNPFMTEFHKLLMDELEKKLAAAIK